MDGLVLDRLIIRALFSSRIDVSEAIALLDLDARALDAAQFLASLFGWFLDSPFSKRR
jgi:hypothetical protein